MLLIEDFMSILKFIKSVYFILVYVFYDKILNILIKNIYLFWVKGYFMWIKKNKF